MAETTNLFWVGLIGFFLWGALGLWSMFEDFPKWFYVLWLFGLMALVTVCFQHCPIRWY